MYILKNKHVHSAINTIEQLKYVNRYRKKKEHKFYYQSQFKTHTHTALNSWNTERSYITCQLLALKILKIVSLKKLLNASHNNDNNNNNNNNNNKLLLLLLFPQPVTVHSKINFLLI